MRQPIPFGKYLLLERINVGGMAEIFLARSRGVQGFKRILAIKKILPTMAEDEEFIAMFIDEARIAAELSHAGIVQIFELGKFEDDYYIAMEFIHGKDLRYIAERMARERKPMDVHLAAHIAFKICEALDYAHTKRDPTGRPLGIIHRDISPQNVILSYDGEVKICDFGIAKAANRSQKTQAGVLKGKFGYMSPEQVRGLPLDGRSDIFTVGTLLYEMITLERLFLGESDFSTLEKVRNADVVPPSTYNRDVPEELEEIVLRALSKEAEDRYQNAAEMADALQLYMINNQHATSRDLSKFMQQSFEAEFQAELRRLEEYQEAPEPQLLEAANEAAGASLGAVQEEADQDAKTLIFASSEEDAQNRSTPPPLPSKAKPSGQAGGLDDLADQPTRIFGDAVSEDLGDAKTMIFDEGGAEIAEDIHELPTRGPGPRPMIDAPVPPQPGPRSWPEKLFFPMTMLIALLIGYSVFTTIQLGLADPGGQAPPQLELTAFPPVGVEVSIDGQPQAGGVPLRTDRLAPGEHQLKLAKAGYEDVERSFRIAANQRLVMEFSLRKLDGQGAADALVAEPRPAEEPSPEAQIDGGTAVAEAPDAGIAATPAAADAAADAGVAAQPADKVEIAAQTPAQLRVRSTPKGATVLLNGRKVGQTPWSGQVQPDQMIKVYLRLRGYQPASETLRPQAGKTSTVKLRLAKKTIRPVKPAKKEYGYLLANTRPWSKVFVDGKYTGRETPIPPDKRLKLTTGKHKVTFEIPGGKRFDFDVVIEANKTLKLIKRLD